MKIQENYKNKSWNKGKDIMLEDIYEKEELFFLQIGHEKTKIKNYVSGNRLDLIDTVIEHLAEIKRAYRDDLMKEFEKS